jgi:hypothetical protein
MRTGNYCEISAYIALFFDKRVKCFTDIIFFHEDF